VCRRLLPARDFSFAENLGDYRLSEDEHSTISKVEDFPNTTYSSVKILSQWFPNADPSYRGSKKPGRSRSRREILVGTRFCIAAIIFLLNLVNTVVLCVKHPLSSDGILTIYTGSYKNVTKINTILHAFINIISTILFSDSNSCI